MSNSKPSSTTQGIACEGWWQEEGWGRQPMIELVLRFESGKIFGMGRDVIGTFTLSGTISEGSKVVMIKQYLGMHAVDYVGAYDGEGLMWGQWRIGPLHDQWMIKFTDFKESLATRMEIKEIG